MLHGASHLLWAKAQSTSNEAETVQSMRDWIDELHCKPKVIVGDVAFFTPTFITLYKLMTSKPCP